MKEKLCDGKFYKCSMLLHDNEYLICHSNTINGNPVYALFINGKLSEVVTGMRLSLDHIHKGEYIYYQRPLEELEQLDTIGFNIYDVIEVHQIEVARFIKNLEDKKQVNKYSYELSKECQEQHAEIARVIAEKKKEEIKEEETNKVFT